MLGMAWSSLGMPHGLRNSLLGAWGRLLAARSTLDAMTGTLCAFSHSILLLSLETGFLQLLFGCGHRAVENLPDLPRPWSVQHERNSHPAREPAPCISLSLSLFLKSLFQAPQLVSLTVFERDMGDQINSLTS